ncbi:JmjC domain-containing protein 8-like [Homarus americanus]|uniref:JmjC domain-containing protein 8-like n=1 Tax=Homarus americanus TaxID=6706 RepID=A0A8J5J7I7_HOMAM|nr:JmjC domain-containing protein 8-like [Homarus americanus]
MTMTAWCVCDASYCDNPGIITFPEKGKFTLVTSTKDGLRFNVEEFPVSNKEIPDDAEIKVSITDGSDVFVNYGVEAGAIQTILYRWHHSSSLTVSSYSALQQELAQDVGKQSVASPQQEVCALWWAAVHQSGDTMLWCQHVMTRGKDRIAQLGPCNIVVQDGSLTQEEFLERYAYSEPVLFQSRTRHTALLERYGHMTIRLSSANSYSYAKRDISFRDYCDHHLHPQQLTTLGNGPGTGVPFHFHGPGFAETIWGRKRWFMYPPDVNPNFHPNRTTLQWLIEDYPKMKDDPNLYECTLLPGEIIYFPDKWWHATLNLDSSVFISTFLSP